MVHFERYYRIQIVAADLPPLISQLSLYGVELQNIEITDSLTMNVDVRYCCYAKINQLVSKLGGSCKIIGKVGHLWKLGFLGKHPVILLGVIAYILVILLIPSHIFFVKVEGNTNIPTYYILSIAEECGIKFGALASDIRSEEIKNQLLESIPQLQWVGISVRGCVASIQIKERSSIQDNTASKSATNIVSSCDGVITDQIVYDGTPLFQTGDAVKKGDVLVSGYIDCGQKYRFCGADAEIFALTKRNQQFISVFPNKLREQNWKEHTCYRLQVGKKVINFCNHSGIMDSDCVKMYMENCWSFPGGFQLPVSVIQITYIDRGISNNVLEDEATQWLPQFARKYMESVMISGKILSEDLQWEKTDEGILLTGNYDCHEMIGREKYEGFIE